MATPEIHSGATTRLKSLPISFAVCQSSRMRWGSSEQKPRRRTRLTCWMLPMVRTSARNSRSPPPGRSRRFTATSDESGSSPRNTAPKPPWPSSSENSLVAVDSSL
ncbi:unnamed protein product [Spirodela intermedia]|uniref:Uncharacterized protein n=1 Tax=Spirodela intermedia TaxID=51605 RepID=A0A7I8ICE5_SPIIN|nr:unnamed protein product [Spirodela intermedia]CAA6655487.1 unnamed protein product [Spirodela intermedia]